MATLEHAEALSVPVARGQTAHRLRLLAWIATWWAIGRVVIVVTAVVVHHFGPSGWIRNVEHAHALGPLSAWDGKWYRMVASSGYLLVPGRQSDPAFFPFYPVLVRGGHAVGLGYSASALLLANLGFFAALVAFHALTGELLGRSTARRATMYLAVFPFGYAFSLEYPESIVLALIAASALAALRGRWALAAAAAAAAALARPEG
ncbi:MAG: hypothetical protein ACRDL2_16925, partial [Gaiellaceae bacterium]